MLMTRVSPLFFTILVLTKPIKQASLIEALEDARQRVAGVTKPKGTRVEHLSDEIFGSIPPPVVQ